MYQRRSILVQGNFICGLLGCAIVGVLLWTTYGVGKRRFEEQDEREPYLEEIEGKIFVNP